MINSDEQRAIEQIHAAGKSLVLSITGGGSGAIARLLEVPGGSASVLEAIVPYSAASLEQWLGGKVDHYCSERTARAMAMASFERARRLRETDPQCLVGIGATASLVSNRPKRGPHRIHVAWQSAEKTVATSCELVKGIRTRSEEEQVATQLILNTVAESCRVGSAFSVEAEHDPIQRREQSALPEWSDLLLGRRSKVAISSAGANANDSPKILFPGAFNPIHTAHLQMAQIATEQLGASVTFELSIINVDKPPLDFVEIADRLDQFAGERVLLTRAPQFVEKAQLAAGCTFVVGVDTIVRIGDSKYYRGGDAERDAAIATIAAAKCRFLVFGRSVQSEFCTLANLRIPATLCQICDEVPESEFRDDISSTELRNA